MSQQTFRFRPRTTLLLLGVVLGVGFLLPALRPLIFAGLLLGVLAYASSSDRWLLFVITAALLVRIFVILVDTQLGLFPQPPIWDNHHQRVQQLVTSWQQGMFFEPTLQTSRMKAVVAHLLAPFYLLFGSDPTSGRFGVAVYGSLVGYPVFAIARTFADERPALGATAVVLFWPSMLFRSVVYQREVMIVLAMLTVVLVAVWWVDRIRPSDFLLLVPAVSMVFVLREQNIVLVMATLGAAIVFRNRGSVVPVVTGVLGVALGAVFIVTWFEQIAWLTVPFSPEAVDAYAHKRARGDAAYLVDLHYRSWLDIVLATPVKVVYYLYSPLPWQVSSLPHLLAGLSGWGVFVATLLLPRSVSQISPDRRKLAVVMSYLVVGVVSYGIIEMNFGAAFRRRIQFIPIILIFVAIALWKPLALRWGTPLRTPELTHTEEE